jgi:hypothetical protein
MKKITRMIAAAALVLGVSMQAQALPPGRGGPGGGHYDCYSCYSGGGWTPGPIHWSTCQKSEDGYGAGCQGGSNGCTFTGGCVSLPDDELRNGLSL